MKEQQAMARIGIDFGGVIVSNRKLVRGEDTGLAGSDKAAVAQDGVFDAFHEIISKAGPRMQARTRAWLDTVDFFSRTGLDADHVRFCLKRQEKEAICRELEISHFVDDHVHVMQILRHTGASLLLRCARPRAVLSTLGDLRVQLGRSGGNIIPVERSLNLRMKPTVPRPAFSITTLYDRFLAGPGHLERKNMFICMCR